KNYSPIDRKSKIKEELKNKYELDITEVYLTQGKGQGIHLYHEDGEHSIYMSGDAYGIFPNDGIHISKIRKKNKKKIKNTERIKGAYHIKENLIKNDILIGGGKRKNNEYVGGSEISFEKFFQEIMKVVKELNDIISEQSREGRLIEDGE
ncbi:MAG: hypothetical protein RBR63_09045, partial [Methanosarcina vacuolata]|nr:hypothetical protein [Methanosarcina vacuolata]